MKMSRGAKIGIAAVGIVLSLCVILLVYSTSGSKKSAAVASKTHCSDCGSPLNKNGDCPKCMAEMGLDAYRARQMNKGLAGKPLLAIFIATAFGLLLMTYIGIHVWAYMKTKKEEVYYTTRCNKCGRKLRYRESQVEHLGKCPICQKPIRFPRPPEKPKVNRWVKIAHYVWG
jgi:hypothetical protein